MSFVRTIPDPGFAGDDGAASPELAAALASYDEDPDASYADTIGVLQHQRLLVPVVALLGEAEYDGQGLAHDKTSDMATVLVRGRDGRLALLAFTSTEALRRWSPDARPVPAGVPRVAQAAVQDQAAAIVVDVAGPVVFVLEERELHALAAGYVLSDVAGALAWVKASG